MRSERKSLCSRRLSLVEIDSNRGSFSACDFDSSGDYILSENGRREIHIRETDGTSGKLALLKGHTNYVHEVHFSRDQSEIYSASLDESIGIWDSMRGYRKTSIADPDA